MKAQKVRKDYDSSAGVYDSRYRDIQFLKYQMMLSSVELKGKILDLGCGTGMLAEFLGRKLFGMDFSFEMLKLARKRGEIVLQGDLSCLPFKTNSFDAVLSFTCLQNSDNADKALSEAKRILTEKGNFILTYLKKFDFSNLIKKYFDIQEVSDCGEDCGFILGK